METLKTDYYNDLWKRARIGLLIGCFIHYVIMVIIKDYYQINSPAVGAPAILSFFIGRWFIKKRIEKTGNLKLAPIFGFGCAMVVFAIQLILGAIFFPMLSKATEPQPQASVAQQGMERVNKIQENISESMWTPAYEKAVREEFSNVPEVKALKKEVQIALVDCCILRLKLKFPKGLENYPQTEVNTFVKSTSKDCIKEVAN